MNFQHDSVEAEKLAEAWHYLWLAASVLSLVAAIGGTAWHAYGVREHRKRIQSMSSEKDVQCIRELEGQ